MADFDDDDLDTGLTTEQRLGLPERDRDYIIPASDGKGQNARLYARVTPSLSRLVSEVLASKKYPFRTPADVVRWCIDNGAKRLAVGRGVTKKGVLMQVEMSNQALREEEYHLQFMDYFKTLENVVSQYVAAGDPGQARRVVIQAKLTVSVVDDEDGGGYWKARYLAEITKKYGTLLDEGESVSLTETDEGTHGTTRQTA